MFKHLIHHRKPLLDPHNSSHVQTRHGGSSVDQTLASRMVKEEWNAFTCLLFVGVFLVGFISAHAEAQEEKYLPCNTGPQTLRQVDTWEREGLGADIRELGRPILPETLADMLIADSSQQLAILSAAAGMDGPLPLQAAVNAWQTNLDFMKWWLQNRRSKTQKP